MPILVPVSVSVSVSVCGARVKAVRVRVCGATGQCEGAAAVRSHILDMHNKRPPARTFEAQIC